MRKDLGTYLPNNLFILAVQEERGPRKRKSSLFSSKNSGKSIEFATQKADRISSLVNLTSANDLHYQILAQILVACIRQAKINENFRCFNSRQQNVILRNVWSECFVLRASHWSIDIGSIIDRLDTFLI